MDSESLTKQIQEIATDRPTLLDMARALGIHRPETLESSDLVGRIVDLQKSEVVATVDLAKLSNPGDGLESGDLPTRNERHGHGRPRGKTNWVKKYKMPFRPKTDQGLIWKWIEQKQPIAVQTVEQRIRSYMLVRHGKLVGLYAGNMLCNIIRNACERGWAVEIKDISNPVTMGLLTVRYVGKVVDPPRLGVRSL